MTENMLSQANRIVDLLETQLALLMSSTSAAQPHQAAGAEARSEQSAPSVGPVPYSERILNQEEIDRYEEAAKQLFNILYRILTGAAAYVLRKEAPNDESSGSGLKVWKAVENKYEPHDENRRRQLERELEASKMKPGTDPDIFITRVSLLAEQINFIGGHITDAKRADIILQGLPREYDLIMLL